MTQYQITLNDDSLKDLFLQDGGVAKLVEQVLNQVLQAQVTEQLKAEPYERTQERQGYRNGTLPHPITTRVGRLVLRVPGFAMASSQPKCLPAISAVSKHW